MDFNPFTTSYIDQRLRTSDGTTFDRINIGDKDSEPATSTSFSLTSASAPGVYGRVTVVLADYAAPPALPTFTFQYGNDGGLTDVMSFEDGVIPLHFKSAATAESTLACSDTVTINSSSVTGLEVTAGKVSFTETLACGDTATFSGSSGTAITVTSGDTTFGPTTYVEFPDGGNVDASGWSFGVVATFDALATFSNGIHFEENSYLRGANGEFHFYYGDPDTTGYEELELVNTGGIDGNYRLTIGNIGQETPITNFARTSELRMVVSADDAGIPLEHNHRRVVNKTTTTEVVVTDYVDTTAMVAFQVGEITLNDQIFIASNSHASYGGLIADENNGLISDADGFTISPNTDASNSTKFVLFKDSADTYVSYESSYFIPTDGAEIYFQTASRGYSAYGIIADKPGLMLTTSASSTPYPHLFFHEDGGMDIYDHKTYIVDRTGAGDFDTTFTLDSNKADVADTSVYAGLRMVQTNLSAGTGTYVDVFPGTTLNIGDLDSTTWRGAKVSFDRSNKGIAIITNTGNADMTYNTYSLVQNHFAIGFENSSIFTNIMDFATTGIVTTTNITSVAPSEDYHLATKLYVDDGLAPLITFKDTHEPTLNNFSYVLSVENPRLLGEVDPGNSSLSGRLLEGTTYFYISTLGTGAAIVDVSDPTAPLVVTYFNPVAPGSFDFLDIKGDYMFVAGAGGGANNGLFVYSLADRLNPVEVDILQTGVAIDGVRIIGDYMAFGGADDNMHMYDVTDPSAPVFLSTTDLTQNFASYTELGTLGVAFHGATGFTLLDISDRSNISLLGRTDNGGGYLDGALHVINGYTLLFTAMGSGIEIYNVTTPAAGLTALIRDTTTGTCEYLLVVETPENVYMLVAGAAGGLYSFTVNTDWSNPADITLSLNAQDDPGSVRFLDLRGSTLYAPGNSGLAIYDVGARIEVTKMKITGTSADSFEVVGGAIFNGNIEVVGLANDIASREQGDPNGFLNSDDSVLSVTEASRTFTIAPAVTEFAVYVNSRRYLKTASENFVFGDVEGLHFIYYDTGGSLAESPTYPTVGAIITLIIWDATNKSVTSFFDERHTIRMREGTHACLHETLGTRHVVGLELGGFTSGDGSVDAHVQYNISDGVIRDEDIRVEITNGSPQTLSPIGEFPVFYRLFVGGSVVWRHNGSGINIPVLSAPAGRLYYNNFTDPDWVLQEATDGYFVNYFVGCYSDVEHPVVVFMGIREYATLDEAVTGAPEEAQEIVYRDITAINAVSIFSELMFVGSITYETNDTFLNSVKSRFVSNGTTTGWTDYRATKGGRLWVTLDHLSLRNRDFDDHKQYALLAGRAGDSLAIDTLTEATLDLGITAEGVLLKDGGIGDSFVTTTVPIGQADSSFISGSALTNFSATSIIGGMNENMAWLNTFNGTCLENFSLSITSDGITITASLSGSVGSQLHLKFHTGTITLDTTTPITATLSPGTATVPIEYRLYILQSNPTVLTVNASGFPTTEAYVPISRVIVQTAALVQTQGVLKQHNYTDHAYEARDVGSNSLQGHLSHITTWIRAQHATYLTGVAQTYTGSGTTTLQVATTSGSISQLHPHTFPAFTTPATMYVVNDSVAPYTTITNLHNLTNDSTGDSLLNRYYACVLWGANNEGDEGKLFLTLPSGSYASEDLTRADPDGFTNYSIPLAFRGVGFLIRRLILRKQAGGTTLFGGNDGGTGDDLRGVMPNSSGGTTTSTVVANAVDSTFRIVNLGDVTKEIAFSADFIETGTTRTLTMANFDLNLGAPSWPTITATTSITSPLIYGTTATTGRLQLRGNTVDLTTGGVSVLDTTASTSTTTGALTVAGGVGIAGSLYIGGSLNFAGSTGTGTWNASNAQAPIGGAATTFSTNACYYCVVNKHVTVTFELGFTATSSGSTINFDIPTGLNSASGRSYGNMIMIRAGATLTPAYVSITAGDTSPITVTITGAFTSTTVYAITGNIIYATT